MTIVSQVKLKQSNWTCNFSLWHPYVNCICAPYFCIFLHVLQLCRGVRLSIFSRLACHSFCWCDCCHILFIEQHSMYVVWTVCLCFSEGMCSEYAVLAFPGPLKRVKQEIKGLLMPRLFYQDAVTDLTANKNGLLCLTVSNFSSGLAFPGNLDILPVLFCCWCQPKRRAWLLWQIHSLMRLWSHFAFSPHPDLLQLLFYALGSLYFKMKVIRIEICHCVIILKTV